MKKKLNRVYIIGTSGSGKTWLAEILSKKLELPSYDLDNIYFIKKYSKRRSENARKKKLLKLASRKKWIINGVFTGWTESAMKKADLVILLNSSNSVLTYRIFKRFLVRKAKGGNDKLIDTWKLSKYARSYKKEDHTSSYIAHKQILKKYKINYLEIKNKKQLNEFLEEIK